MLLVSHDMSVISAKENMSRNPEFSSGLYQRFDLNEILEPECKAEMRFNKNDIPVLAEALELPERFACSQRTIVDKLEGLCLLLRQTGYICCYSNLTRRPGRPVPELSMITNCVIDHVYNSHGHCITRWNHQNLKPPLLQTYADSIAEQGALLDNCFGFIAGTVRPISRPAELLEVVFHCHTRVHSIKFQSITVRPGLIANPFGSVGELKLIHDNDYNLTKKKCLHEYFWCCSLRKYFVSLKCPFLTVEVGK